ncbi:uncharacterized protein SOCEGT47_027760 [Sorangium cellulosum]|uniref:Uncharacterized protein n=1 Tax=Sorangium cellulosum TaxID=56 RepID=A0A4P2PZE8_SORCE|nr:uncharacterized protein SOCEGT47_027760 [Sorangium cellulosum]
MDPAGDDRGGRGGALRGTGRPLSTASARARGRRASPRVPTEGAARVRRGTSAGRGLLGLLLASDPGERVPG